MIIILSQDDLVQLRAIAQASVQQNPGVFGDIYPIGSPIPPLGLNENLFVIAHGAFDDASGNPVIGDENEGYILDGLELWDNLQGIFPQNYTGNVYIDACESADHNNEVFSFIEVFYSQTDIHLPNTSVFGVNGDSAGTIDLPGDPSWVQAGLENQDLKGATPKNPKPLPTNLKTPQKSPYNLQATKYYVFNETGNIMMATTDDSSSQIQQSVRDVFNEVSVFFAAMTKAISTTINPSTKKAYSIYNYDALSKIISGSGLFIHVTEEDINYTSEKIGADFSKELIEGLLGLATGVGELSFAEAMIQSMGSAGLNISQQSSSETSSVANIVFVCEYLMGMPIVSALVVYLNTKEQQQSLSVGPCFKESSQTMTWKMHKDTYMFVTPTFIKKYSGDLMSGVTDPVYNEFIEYLSDLVSGKVSITGVADSDNNPVRTTLEAGKGYYITGVNFGTKSKGAKLMLGKTQLTGVSVNENVISFQAPSKPSTTPAIIQYFLPNNSTSTPDASSVDSFTVVS